MDNVLNFFVFVIQSFSSFFDWFFNTQITLGNLTIYPYMLFSLSTIIVIIGFLIVRLVVGG